MKDLLRHKWALAESYFNQMYPVFQDAVRLGHTLGKKKTLEDCLVSIEALLSIPENEGHAIDTSRIMSDVQVTFGNDGPTGLPIARTNGKNIALIPVIGPLTKYGDLCSIGMQDYQRLLNRANTSPSIDGIVLIMDTPGGTVDGTPEFGLAIKNSMKPVGVFGDAMVASAGLWLASQSSVIVGNKNNPTQFGSIGVLMALPNYQNVMEAGNHPKVEIFRASQSSEKALVNSVEPITDEGRKGLQAQLDATATQFITTVKAGRGDKLDTKADGLFNGRMFDVYEAKKIGLIDAIGTLQTAVNKVAELAKQKAASKEGTNQNANMKFPKLSALLGAAMAMVTGSGSEASNSLTPEQTASLEASEKKLSEQESEIAQLKVSIEEKDKTISSLNANVASLNEEKTKLETANADLQKKVDEKPNGSLTTIISKEETEEKVNADAGAVEKTAGKYRSSADDEADKYSAASNVTLPKK